jgi:vacuolar-type H+-ATPase subunit E/Vma4
MSAPESIVQAQREALLRRVAREQEMLSRRARDAAEEQARGLVARAREEAAARVRQAAEEAHRAVGQAVADRRAALETAARQREQTVLRELMDTAWQQLPDVLAGIWAQPEARRAWCDAASALAERTLMGDGEITIEVDDAEGGDLAADARQFLQDRGCQVTLREVAALGPGLRVRRGLATVDATTNGLLASRERIESELLAELDALIEATGRDAR